MSAEPMQLTIDGDERPLSEVSVAPAAELSRGQAEILHWMRYHGGCISPTRAGVILHRLREPPTGARGVGWEPCSLRDSIGFRFGEGCCRYAASSGNDAMKRLARRGLVERISRGTWVLRPGETS